MAKKSFKLEDVEFALDKNQIEAEKKQALLTDLQAMLEEETEAKEPKNKKEFVVLVSDPNGNINTDLVAWVLQIEEGESPDSVKEKLSLAAAKFNNTKKGQKMPVETVGETIEVVQRKIMVEEAKVWIKTKVPVLVVTTDNSLIDLGGE
jgi:hypothetical protein